MKLKRKKKIALIRTRMKRREKILPASRRQTIFIIIRHGRRAEMCLGLCAWLWKITFRNLRSEFGFSFISNRIKFGERQHNFLFTGRQRNWNNGEIQGIWKRNCQKTGIMMWMLFTDILTYAVQHFDTSLILQNFTMISDYLPLIL